MPTTTEGYHTLFYDKHKRPTPNLGVSVRLTLVEVESGSFSRENKRRISKIFRSPNVVKQRAMSWGNVVKGDPGTESGVTKWVNGVRFFDYALRLRSE